jgi:predicted acylesterase/phospholipase RssA
MDLRALMCERWQSKEYVVVGPAGAHGGVLLGVVAGMLGAEGGDPFRKWRSGLKGAAGVSIGSLFAVGLTMGVDIRRLRCLMNRFPFGPIFTEDGKVVLESAGMSLTNGFNELSRLQGIMSGASLFAVGEYVLAAAGLRSDVTFKEIFEATNFDLRIVATDLNSCKPIVFSHAFTPNTQLIHAMAASMCIPVLFKPIRIKGNENFRRFVCVDGAISDPFGLCAFPAELQKDNVLVVAKNVNLRHSNRTGSLATILMSSLTMATQANLNCARIPFHNFVLGMVGVDTGKDETQVKSWAQLFDSPDTDEFVVDGICSVENMVLTHALLVMLYVRALAEVCANRPARSPHEEPSLPT